MVEKMYGLLSGKCKT